MTTTIKAPSLVIRPRDWMRELGVGKHGLAILIRDHGHPKPFALGKRSSGFDRAECEAWLEARKAQRDQANA
ncbi:AlpA family phage regulatory protein [Sphingomonas sediminicola]|uniref:AlpA family phage regulatory protein n=1 Tax=Sphingomonas sediminicola TaxID=386874 RepID=A0ABX6T8F8_9SPHN|nr:AlpA family phage regulatory protein [Sphingomonas sediminicola]QNP46060.1 AlpA family phage regulatory protein [Sphingomonas sediminicola]